MSSSIVPSDHQIVQNISFTIWNDSTFERRFTKEGRRWTKAMQTIEQQEGWLQNLYGRDMYSFHKVDLYIVWKTLALAEAFTSTPLFEATLAGVAVSPLSHHYIELQGSLGSYGPIEIVTLSFPPTLSDEDQRLFDDQVEHCKRLGPPMVHGWTVPTDHGKSRSNTARECTVLFKWESLDEMYEVKSNEDSMFNNGFVPLRNKASEGSKTVLYTKLRDTHSDRSRCIMM